MSDEPYPPLIHPAIRETRRTRLLASIAANPPGWACGYCEVPLVPLGTCEALALVVTTPDGSIYAAEGYRFPQVEHVIPRARGGSDSLSNLVLACGPCNVRKGTMTADEYEQATA